ncbi:probable dolichyl pyrophosphate Glc1Man9GlcNAc2 alpha-1,3-glucosyltransferase [Oppia nitens]|uniref:probable dolichyl pyrophosphate Glc1Man9GlcNAc2 alpha-1,3-glucosyltransferase n=1 Tax=Oppia nitens TaxID=1686743 RepID=UPI0023DBD7B3|nr:probable dolichyl pyrophosphate Glc1Man9GlcNAc2 alpha-1,3-glucosyltransferase [Oppia nitens]
MTSTMRLRSRNKSSDDNILMQSIWDYKFWSMALSITCVKLLLIKSYYSTDFEVHRNWLSITHSLPISQWYYESTSEWTLDYPPLFAWFEYLLSLIGQYFDENMLKIAATGYISDQTILFQRLTVIGSDLVYYYSVFEWCQLMGKLKANRSGRQSLGDQWFHPNVMLVMLFLWNPGLLLVDHIHFQYNGLLSGILLLSMARIVQKREVEASLWFSILLNMKHIYMYMSPAFFVYLLRNYCFDRHRKFRPINLAKLAVTVLSVFAISFGPFVAMGQLNQLVSRLFPFRRGLSHAYWAPNFWALYNTVDKSLGTALKIKSNTTTSSSTMTSGLVQQYEHQVLFNIAPIVTFILVIVAIMPSLYTLWKRSHQNYSHILFLRCVVLCAYSSYMFGWHVHEKAILLITIPLTPLAMITKWDGKWFAWISIVGNYSLFPLLFKESETITKIVLLLIYSIYSLKSLDIYHRISSFNTSKHYSNNDNTNSFFSISFPLMNSIETMYLLGLISIQLIYSIGCPLFAICHQSYPFIPLMLTSFYCSLGLTYCYYNYFRTMHIIKA